MGEVPFGNPSSATKNDLQEGILVIREANRSEPMSRISRINAELNPKRIRSQAPGFASNPYSAKSPPPNLSLIHI